MDQAGIDQNKLCEDLNFKYSTVSGWLSAEKYPRIDKIEILSHYFGIKKADLVEDNNKTDKLGRIFVDVTTALNLNIPEMQEDLGVDRKTIERLIINKNTFLKKEFKLLGVVSPLDKKNKIKTAPGATNTEDGMCASPLTTTEKRTRQCYKDTTTAPFYLTTKWRR